MSDLREQFINLHKHVKEFKAFTMYIDTSRFRSMKETGFPETVILSDEELNNAKDIYNKMNVYRNKFNLINKSKTLNKLIDKLHYVKDIIDKIKIIRYCNVNLDNIMIIENLERQKEMSIIERELTVDDFFTLLAVLTVENMFNRQLSLGEKIKESTLTEHLIKYGFHEMVRDGEFIGRVKDQLKEQFTLSLKL